MQEMRSVSVSISPLRWSSCCPVHPFLLARPLPLTRLKEARVTLTRGMRTARDIMPRM